MHGHWLLARLVRAFPKALFATDAVAALKANRTPARIAGEVAYLNATGRESPLRFGPAAAAGRRTARIRDA